MKVPENTSSNSTTNTVRHFQSSNKEYAVARRLGGRKHCRSLVFSIAIASETRSPWICLNPFGSIANLRSRRDGDEMVWSKIGREKANLGPSNASPVARKDAILKHGC